MATIYITRPGGTALLKIDGFWVSIKNVIISFYMEKKLRNSDVLLISTCEDINLFFCSSIK